MKVFEMPAIELIKFSVEDVITASGFETGDNQTPPAIRP